MFMIILVDWTMLKIQIQKLIHLSIGEYFMALSDLKAGFHCGEVVDVTFFYNKNKNKRKRKHRAKERDTAK